MSRDNLEGKVAVVTGASRGIGAATAERLARDGATVVVNYSRSEKDAADVVSRIKKAGGSASMHGADMSDPAQAKGLIEATFKEQGRLDILVNNASVANFLPLEAIDEEHVRAHLDLNVTGIVFATQAAAAYLPRDGGRVINVSALGATKPTPGISLYSASKAALNALTRVWAMELGPRGITVNAVSPGPVETEMFRAAATEDVAEYLISRTPLGRIGTPDDVAGVIAFLASADGRWVTGEVIDVGGGCNP